ncbi:fimbria/pilus outer membrane usher protein [Ramlibacter sp.]|uniref:fimbria/pilus outer membrane usher protein n=1 Tax=Ramlibacter sp. TaxID=1917967 RepID=UPI003D0C6E90
MTLDRRTSSALGRASLPIALAASLAAAPRAGWAQGAAETPAAPTPPAASPRAPAQRFIPLEVTVNNSPSGSWTLLEREGVLYAPAEAFDEWRLQRRPGAPSAQARGQTWYSLGAVPGFQARMNAANQSVELVFSPAAFARTRVDEGAAPPQRARVATAEPALFLNFDTNLSRTQQRSTGATTDVGVLSELGYSTPAGVFTSSFVTRHLQAPGQAAQTLALRLETTFTRDWPQRNLTLRAGDSVTRGGLLARPVYFGGVQLGRNFALTPGFVSQPVPVIAGTSSAPSTVELYVGDALRKTASVPAGPFVIDNFPLLSGAGEARIVVRDVLGRETVVVQPFFTSSYLLEQGLSDWSVEAGAVRLNLGSQSNNYGERFASALYRLGITKRFTAEASAQLGEHTRNIGVGGLHGLPYGLLGMAAYRASQNVFRGRGGQWLLAVENSSLRHGFSVRAVGATRGFSELGTERDVLPNQLEVSSSYSFSDDRWGTFALGAARISTFDRGDISTYSANYSVPLSPRSALSLNLTRVAGASGGVSATVNYTIALDNRTSVTAVGAHRSGGNDAYVSANKGLTEDTGLGWRVLGGGRESRPYAEGGLYYQGGRMLLTADASASSEQQTLRVGAQGALVWMDGDLYASRRIDNSFALVEVPGYANVGIGVHGRLLTRTDAEGKALVPGLLPYQDNSIRLDPSELPISAEIDNIEQIVSPPMRSGVKVTFPVRSGRGALIRIVFDDGEPAPAGAELELVGDTQEFYVARRGEAFVTGLQASNTLRLKWKGAQCEFAVQLPPGAIDEIARVGPLRCEGVKR